MTEEEKQKIKKLRYQGFGYKQIAKATGLSRDMVRGYCLRNGLHCIRINEKDLLNLYLDLIGLFL